MSVEGNVLRRGPDQALLCWSEAPHSPAREEFVQVLESHLAEAVIKSSLEVSEQTKVTLIGKDYTGIGTVKSCRRDGKSFILTISIGDAEMLEPMREDRDPGVLTVDSFVTEEEEAKILQDLDDWTAFGNGWWPAPLSV
jgi:hypothetical protein